MRHHMTSALNPLFTMPINVTTKEKKHTQNIARSLSHKYAKSKKERHVLFEFNEKQKEIQMSQTEAGKEGKVESSDESRHKRTLTPVRWWTLYKYDYKYKYENTNTNTKI